MIKTMIQGGYVVAFDGKGHRILRDGVVVFQDGEIIHVGKSYDGQVDRVIDAKGKLVSPGFINIHALASTSITQLRLDGLMSALSVSSPLPWMAKAAWTWSARIWRPVRFLPSPNCSKGAAPPSWSSRPWPSRAGRPQKSKRKCWSGRPASLERGLISRTNIARR